MGFLRRICGAVVLLLAAVGTICCVAGVVGAWLLCHETSERVRRISDRIDAGLLRMSVASENVSSAVGKARADVAAIDKESADLGGGGEKSRRAARSVRTLIQQQTRPDVDDLGGRLDTLADASVAIASLLQSVEELPLERNLRLDPDQLKRTADDAHQLSAILQRIEAAVGDSDKDVDPREVTAETSKVEIVLEKCQTTLSKWQSDLADAREKLAELKAEIIRLLRYAAAGVTVLCSWIGAGQICLFLRGWRWCRGI